MVREITDLLFNTFVPAAGEGLDELKSEVYSCGGCTGLIKFQIEDDPEMIEQGVTSLPDSKKMKQSGKSEPGSPSGNHEGVVVSGQISEIFPSELLQFFHMHQKTGKPPG